MKTKKLIGVLLVTSLFAVVASTILVVNSGPVTDEPIGERMLPGGAGPVTDEPIGNSMLPGGAGPVTDEPIGEGII